jgi:hypothetical protein
MGRLSRHLDGSMAPRGQTAGVFVHLEIDADPTVYFSSRFVVECVSAQAGREGINITEKSPRRVSASVSTSIKKVSQSTFLSRSARESGDLPVLYIIYIYSGNTDALTQSPVCRRVRRVSINFVQYRRALSLLARGNTDAPALYIPVALW